MLIVSKNKFTGPPIREGEGGFKLMWKKKGN